jgi:hypothetical protein
MSQSNGRFIVGAGRCGSTILSRMVNLHPDVAVFNEFLIAMHFHDKWGERDLTGAQMADIIDCGVDAGSGAFKKIIAHLVTPEVTFQGGAASLPTDASAYRDNVFPDVLLLPLPHLFDDPENVLAELMAFVRARPAQKLSRHYAAIFDYLTAKAGKTIWIERSGGSIAWMPELLELFPDGKYLHLHRNPLDVALSMQRHNHFRLRAFKHFDLTTKDGIRWSDLDETDLNNNQPISPRLKSVMEHEVPLEYFLEDVNECILRGMKEVKRLAPSQYAEIAFEEMMADPKAALKTLADFFDLREDETWLADAAALLRSGQAARNTPTAEQTAMLKQRCRASMVLLGQAPAMELYP